MRNGAKDWSLTRLGNLRGKTIAVTGANSGIGFHGGFLGRRDAAQAASAKPLSVKTSQRRMSLAISFIVLNLAMTLSKVFDSQFEAWAPSREVIAAEHWALACWSLRR
jgi:hypothetical protein